MNAEIQSTKKYLYVSGEVEYTAIPPSPIFSRTPSQQADLVEDRIDRVDAGRANQKSPPLRQSSNEVYARGGRRISDKQSVVSGTVDRY